MIRRLRSLANQKNEIWFVCYRNLLITRSEQYIGHSNKIEQYEFQYVVLTFFKLNFVLKSCDAGRLTARIEDKVVRKELNENSVDLIFGIRLT